MLLQKLLPLTKTMENFRLAVYETRCALSDLLQVIRTNKTSSFLRCQLRLKTPPNICQDRLGTNIFPRELSHQTVFCFLAVRVRARTDAAELAEAGG
eukprot:COSAG06_NODE_25706_length_630_cov_1.651601_1_plen_96_part_01